MATTTPSGTPHIHLMSINDRELAAFKAHHLANPLSTSVNITTHKCRLSDVPQSVIFDAMVLPANPYGRMDLGFDHFHSKTFSQQQDYLALTRLVHGVL